jgi:hypothetical protein
LFLQFESRSNPTERNFILIIIVTQVLPSAPRSDTESVSTGETSTPNSAATFQLCGPTEHMWVKDVPTICVACGLCTARGMRCPARTASPTRGSICPCGQGESGCLRYNLTDSHFMLYFVFYELVTHAKIVINGPLFSVD